MKLQLLALLFAFFVSLFIGPMGIRLLKRLKFGQQVRDDGPKSHLVKQNTPTMGGVMMLLAIGLGALLFQLQNIAFIAVLTAAAYCLVGFLDDIIKIVKKRSLGLRAYQKIIGQLGLAIIVAFYAYRNPQVGSSILLPGGGSFDLGVFYIPVAVFIILAIVNGVNLIDGLDGLATSNSTVLFASYGVLCALPFLQNASPESLFTSPGSQLATFCALCVGACLGFLRFNAYPARVIMGDSGAFLLGGGLAAVTLFSRLMLFFPLMGFMMVATCLSVILQVGSYKLRKKRVFLMAPLHHHYELKGYHETNIVVMYTLITLLCCVAAFLLY